MCSAWKKGISMADTLTQHNASPPRAGHAAHGTKRNCYSDPIFYRETMTFSRFLRVAIATIPLMFLAAIAQAQIGTPVDIGSNQTAFGVANSVGITTTQAVPAGASIIVIANSQPNGSGAATPTSVACSDSAGHTYNTDVSQFNS